METPASRGGRWLAFPRILWLSLAAALVLSLPMFLAGFVTDDYVYLGVLSGRPAPGPLPNTSYDLYRYVDGNPDTLQQLVTRGVYPWWTLPELRLAFWRPLSSALAVVDHRLFGMSPTGYQAHSILWYLAAVAVAGLLYRRLLPGLAAGLAVLLFALDDAHAVPVGWISNRNALVSAVPAMLGLWMHLEWRERGRIWALPLSIAGLALGLAGGEGALGFFAYLGCYELLGHKGPLRQRLLALVPAVLLGLAYVSAYKWLGYGAFGSDFYIDPARQPGPWLANALTRVPALLSGLLLSLPSDLALSGPGFQLALGLAGLLGVVAVGLLVRAAWPDLEEQQRRHLRWLMAGAALSLLPVASTLPSNRLLLTPSLGGAAMVGVALTQLWRWREQAWRPRVLAMGAAVLVLLHMGTAPYFWWETAAGFRAVSARGDRIHGILAGELDSGRLAQQRVAVLAAPDPMVGMYTAARWWMGGGVLPRAWWTLSFSPEVHRATRTGPSTLELELERGRFLATRGERLYRYAAAPVAQGTEVDMQGVRVKVLEADAEGPRRLGVTFDAPLEDPSLVLLYWKEGALRRLQPPPTGGQVLLNVRMNVP
jgi:hypothetical protein